MKQSQELTVADKSKAAGGFQLRNIPSYLKTVFLLNKSDFKTIIIPAIVTSSTLTPLAGLHRLPHVAFWVWVQIVHCDLVNQALRVDEDRLNKPYRPIVAGRLTIATAMWLRWVVVVLGFFHSRLYSAEVVCAAVGNLIIDLVYNELDGDRCHWALRQLLIGPGYMPYHYGAALIAGSSVSHLDDLTIKALLTCTVIFLTTAHCQDFKDVAGDAAVGRATMPMVHPFMSRLLYMFFVIFWSIVLSVYWELEMTLAAAFIGFSVLIGAYVMMFRSVKADQLSFQLYEVYMTLTFLVPAYYKYKTQYATI